MNTLKFVALLSLPLALSAVAAHADTHSSAPQGAYQTECEHLLHGDVSTLDMKEYQARWSECFGEVKKADAVAGERAAQPAGEKHQDCHQHRSHSAEQNAGVQADNQQATGAQDRRKKSPSNITRKRGPRR